MHTPNPIEPRAGRVTLITRSRAPYASVPTWTAVELDQASDTDLPALLSQASSANTASTSELLGAVRMLCAMARAVRNRSYVLMAASISDPGALPLLIDASRVSKASVMSFTVIGLSVWEIDLGGNSTAHNAATEGGAV